MRRVKSDQADEIRAIKRMKDSEIDTTDIPPLLDWSKAVVGKFYRPIKKPLTIRVDADVLAWLKAQGRGAVRLGYDTSLYSGPDMAPGWTDSLVYTGNVTPIVPLEADQGRLTANGAFQDDDDPTNYTARTKCSRRFHFPPLLPALML